MEISPGHTPLLPGTEKIQQARGLTRHVNPDGMFMVAEKTEEEQQATSSPISFQRQLTPEEEKRVIFLQNMLSQLLTMSDGKPSEEQRAHIKEVEEELEKITGVKMRSSISDTTNKMVGDKDDEEDDNQKQTKGIDPKEAAHGKMPETGKSNNPGMQMLQQNSLFTQLQSMIDQSGLISSIKTS